ncbi:MAG: PhnD/SsuA/transferrin family substrate-binding protein, partial [Anaerolineae bacterium]|nr:PhnD/SsuA/transferrin family substrate-binding protein [Anaerolineae bacterium]
ENQVAADALAAQVSQISDVTIEVEFVRSQAEALSALCNATPDSASMVWLIAFAAGDAAMRDCGIPRIQITREVGRDSLTGEAGVLLANFEIDFEEPDIATVQLQERTFCRIALEDFYSWSLPTLLFAANGLSIMEFQDINEVEDEETLFATLQDGTCDAIALPERTWETYVDTDETLVEGINVLATSPEFPYGVLFFSYDVSLEVIDTLTEALLVLEADGLALEVTPEAAITTEALPEAEATESAEPVTFADLFGEGQFVTTEAEDFTSVANFLQETGLNFTQVGD